MLQHPGCTSSHLDSNMKRSRRSALFLVTQTPDCHQLASRAMTSCDCTDIIRHPQVDAMSLTRQRTLEHRIVTQARELDALKQVLERLKGAVFHCDAQNTALQVALKKQNPIRKLENNSERNGNVYRELSQLRETLVRVMFKVKELEEQVKNKDKISLSKVEPVSLTTIDENVAPTDFITEDIKPTKYADRNNVHLELQSIKQQWKEAEQDWDQERLELLNELNAMQLDCEEQEAELRLIEAERIRLAAHENKLVESLKLLRNLKLVNFPKRTLGKILLEALASAEDQKKSELRASSFLDSLYENLVNYDTEINDSLIPMALQINPSE